MKIIFNWLKTKLKLKNVDFKYQNSDEFIFENISLEFEKGSHTITGENGSEKHVTGFSSGNILSPEWYSWNFSKKYGYVSAQPYIFKDTLYNNIMYGNEDIKVQESDLIKTLKDFKTFKNESEYNLERLVSNKSLSSGQMQKIGFVRIMVSKPDIILLDESTSNLDKDSKEIVFKKLKDNHSTVINSTHDPENFDFVDNHIQIQIIDEKRKIEKIL